MCRRLVIALILAAARPVAAAQDEPLPPPPPPQQVQPQPPPPHHPPAHHLQDLQLRLDELEQQHAILARKYELSQEQLAEEKKKGVTVTAAPGRGLTVSTNDKIFAIQWRARAQIRYSLQNDKTAGTTNEINVRTVRLIVAGHLLTPDLKYTVQLAFGANDFEPGNASPLFDAFIDYTKIRDFNIRFGQYFVPFDRARTIREFALQFIDRQISVIELNLDRDVGFMFYSNDLGGVGGRLGYALGIFGGDGRNRFGFSNPHFLYTARFNIKPWGNFDDDVEGDLLRLPRPRLAIGIAGAFNQGTLRNRSTIGSTLTLGGYDYVHGAADLVFKYAGFSLLAEFLLRRALWDNRMGLNAAGMPITEWSRSGYGYFVQAGMMVHKKVEITARWDQLFAWWEGQTDPTLYTTVDTIGRQVGGGMNVYLNGHLFKFQADYFYLFGNAAADGRHQVRVQLDASF